MNLFMVEIKVSDWSETVTWFVDTLGLLLVLRDNANQFALLQAGDGRLAIKESKPSEELSHDRLVFQVADVDLEKIRLQKLGVEVSEPLDNLQEQYRELRLSCFGKIPISLFCWTDQA